MYGNAEVMALFMVAMVTSYFTLMKFEDYVTNFVWLLCFYLTLYLQ